MKSCPTCKLEKCLDEFVTDNRKTSGRGAMCRACHREITRRWWRENRSVTADDVIRQRVESIARDKDVEKCTASWDARIRIRKALGKLKNMEGFTDAEKENAVQYRPEETNQLQQAVQGVA